MINPWNPFYGKKESPYWFYPLEALNQKTLEFPSTTSLVQPALYKLGGNSPPYFYSLVGVEVTT